MKDHSEVQGVDSEMQVVVFRLKREEFGVDIHQVREIIRYTDITHIPETPGHLEGVINLRGEVVPVIDLVKQFGMGAVGERAKDTRIVIVEVDDSIVGMIVDAVPEVLRIQRNQVEAVPETIESKVTRNYLRGVGKVNDRLIILLDLEKVMSEQQKAEARTAQEAVRE